MRTLLHLWYACPYYLQDKQNPYISPTGTFWIVQGTTMMPFFATGTHFSSTGNFLEGTETPMYNASIGPLRPIPFSIGYADLLDRILLCGPDSLNLHIPDMLYTYQRLPLLRALLALHHLWNVRRRFLQRFRRESSSGCEIATRKCILESCVLID